MAYGQYFCTISEMDADLNLYGSESVDKLFRAVRDASIFLAQRLGDFIPVSETKILAGSGLERLFLPTPLLAVTTAITNDGDTLVSADYVLQPSVRHWASGPYTYLAVAPDAVNLSAWSDEINGVVIPGRWGKYDMTEASGAVLAAGQDAVAITMQVNDGSKVSPGMTVVIDAEQELVTGVSTPTTSVTTLAVATDASSEVLTLASGTTVKKGEVIRIEFEQMRIEDDPQGALIVVRRGWNGTKKVAHTINKPVDIYRTFTVSRGLNGTTAAIHNNAAAVSRYLVPGDVNYLCRQIAALMLKKAQAGFAGKTGNAELGEVYYNDEFPRFAMKEIEQNYTLPRIV